MTCEDAADVDPCEDCPEDPPPPEAPGDGGGGGGGSDACCEALLEAIQGLEVNIEAINIDELDTTAGGPIERRFCDTDGRPFTVFALLDENHSGGQGDTTDDGDAVAAVPAGWQYDDDPSPLITAAPPPTSGPCGATPVGPGLCVLLNDGTVTTGFGSETGWVALEATTGSYVRVDVAEVLCADDPRCCVKCEPEPPLACPAAGETVVQCATSVRDANAAENGFILGLGGNLAYINSPYLPATDALGPSDGVAWVVGGDGGGAGPVPPGASDVLVVTEFDGIPDCGDIVASEVTFCFEYRVPATFAHEGAIIAFNSTGIVGFAPLSPNYAAGVLTSNEFHCTTMTIPAGATNDAGFSIGIGFNNGDIGLGMSTGAVDEYGFDSACVSITA